MVVFALVSAGCGAPRGDQEAQVSAGPRPPAVSATGRLVGPGGLGAAAPPVVAPAIRPIGPILPQAGPQPGQMGPNVPGDRPSAQPNILAAVTGQVSAALGDVPDRAYVPNSEGHTITVIDPHTFAVIATYKTGTVPHHITPSWDLTKLYVNNTTANTLTVIDPRDGKP